MRSTMFAARSRCTRGLKWIMRRELGTHCQALENGVLVGDPVELDKGDADWEPARFTATGSSVIWQKMPFATGAKSSEFSHCYLWNVGDEKGEDLYESPGRFATWPRVSDGYLTHRPPRQFR